MANHITVISQILQSQLVTRIPAGPATPDPTYIVHQAQQFTQAAPVKNKIPVDCCDLQAASPYSLIEVQGPEGLPEIWQNLAPLKNRRHDPPLR